MHIDTILDLVKDICLEIHLENSHNECEIVDINIKAFRITIEYVTKMRLETDRTMITRRLKAIPTDQKANHGRFDAILETRFED